MRILNFLICNNNMISKINVVFTLVFTLFYSSLLFSSESEGWMGSESLPEAEIRVICGDLLVRFDAQKKWTLSRIEKGGDLIGNDHIGTSYGTVLKYSDVGFVGTGHITEENQELVSQFRIRVNGEWVSDPKGIYTCDNFYFEKGSTINSVELLNSWEVEANVIREKVSLLAIEETTLDLAYVFMLPWRVSMTNYLASSGGDVVVEGPFDGDNSFKIMKPADWVSIYDEVSGVGVVTKYEEVDELAAGFTRLWDKSSPYKKHYYQIFTKQTLPAGRRYNFRAVTYFFNAPSESWRSVAASIAE